MSGELNRFSALSCEKCTCSTITLCKLSRTRALLAMHRFTELAPVVVVHFLPDVLAALSACVQDDDAVVRDAANRCDVLCGSGNL
jgi:hypothetical protein